MLQALGQVIGASEYRGKGGRVTSTMIVTPGDTLYLYVGGKVRLLMVDLEDGMVEVVEVIICGRWWCFDIRINGTELVNRVIVAGGGGSNGSSQFGTNTGGHGGGLTGGASTIPGYFCVSYGGRQYRGGASPVCSCGNLGGRSGGFGYGVGWYLW